MSGFIDKEKQLLEKLRQTNYEMFDGNREEALDFVSQRLTAFPNYANVVIREQILTPIWRLNMEGQQLRDQIMGMDQRRRSSHDNAIASLNGLNRMCKRLGIGRFADIDTSDRHAVADFVGDYVNELYNSGIGKGFDAATCQKDRGYDTGRTRTHILEMEQEFRDIAGAYGSGEDAGLSL